jgi:hypothetical protein
MITLDLRNTVNFGCGGVVQWKYRMPKLANTLKAANNNR